MQEVGNKELITLCEKKNKDAKMEGFKLKNQLKSKLTMLYYIYENQGDQVHVSHKREAEFAASEQA